MKLTVAVKLLPSSAQANALRETLRRSNAASNYVSEVAWAEGVFGKYALQKLTYHEVKSRFELAAQAAIQAVRKVADSYRLDTKTHRVYRKFGSIAYDDRILSWKPEVSEVSIWTVAGREKMPFTCDERARRMLATRRGESDLAYRDGKFYLLATAEVEEPPPGEPEDWFGVDLGIVALATDSDGETRATHEARHEPRNLEAAGIEGRRNKPGNKPRRSHRHSRAEYRWEIAEIEAWQVGLPRVATVRFLQGPACRGYPEDGRPAQYAVHLLGVWALREGQPEE